jgi:hypothetical protein
MVSEDEVVITTPTRTLSIGSRDDVLAAKQAISRVTGGSSLRGQWSSVFGLVPESVEMSDDRVRHLSLEARDIDMRLAHALPAEARTFLDRLASLSDQPG